MGKFKNGSKGRFKDGKVQYTPDGDRVTVHEHDWVMMDVTMHPNPDAKRPLAGVTVLWRCHRRGCQGFRQAPYRFLRPRSNQQPNMLSPTLDTIMQGELRQRVMAEISPIVD